MSQPKGDVQHTPRRHRRGSNISKSWLTAFFEHSENWKTVWFGLIFWGSVLFALAQQMLTGVNPWLLGTLAYLMGLLLGIMAKLRGRWV